MSDQGLYRCLQSFLSRDHLPPGDVRSQEIKVAIDPNIVPLASALTDSDLGRSRGTFTGATGSSIYVAMRNVGRTNLRRVDGSLTGSHVSFAPTLYRLLRVLVETSFPL